MNGIDPSGLCKSYWDRYMDHLDKYLINVSYFSITMVGGLWPKSWVPRTGGRPPALGSKNPLTSIPRALIPGAKGIISRGSASLIGVATVAIGYYNIGIFAGGFAYAAFNGDQEDCKCKK